MNSHGHSEQSEESKALVLFKIPMVTNGMVNLRQTEIEFTAEVFQEGDSYVALCPELNVSSFGPTPQKAKEALKEAMGAFVEGCRELGTLEEVLYEAGFNKQGQKWVGRTPLAQERLSATL